MSHPKSAENQWWKRHEIKQDASLDVKSDNPVCSHPIQHQIEDSGHVWQYCKGKNCHRKLFVRDI